MKTQTHPHRHTHTHFHHTIKAHYPACLMLKIIVVVENIRLTSPPTINYSFARDDAINVGAREQRKNYCRGKLKPFSLGDCLVRSR